ncbi:hypothetical protein [Solidesulfovibrio sp.]|uniref:hypothetical protein n=1 Tax=Solidesulfovibrio sp. TaxID=2910990 RepID=UPI00260D65DD|nr:hypothetical protein [Solidesulfovibrio sp.]
MLSHSSISSRRQAKGWAKSFFGPSRQNAETPARRQPSEFDQPPAPRSPEPGETK